MKAGPVTLQIANGRNRKSPLLRGSGDTELRKRIRSEDFLQLKDLQALVVKRGKEGFTSEEVAEKIRAHPYIQKALERVREGGRYPTFDTIQVEASILATWELPWAVLAELFHRKNIQTSVARFNNGVAQGLLESAERLKHGAWKTVRFLPRLKKEILTLARESVSQKLEKKIWPWPKKLIYGHGLLLSGQPYVTPEGRENLEKTAELIFSGQQVKPAARAAGVPEKEVSSVHWSLRSPLLCDHFKHDKKIYHMIEDPVFDEGTWKCIQTILEDPNRPRKLGWGRLFKDGKQVPNPTLGPVIDEICRLRVQERISEYETQIIRKKLREKCKQKDLEKFIGALTRGVIHNILTDEFWKPLSHWWEKAASVKRPHASIEEEGIENRVNVQHLIEKKGQLRSGEIAQALELHKATVIKHLRRLEADRVILREGRGTSTVYRPRVAAFL